MTGDAWKIIAFLSQEENKGKTWDLKEHKEKRSNDANAFFWTLVNQLSIYEGLSDTEVHDKYLSENRAYFYNDEGALDWKVSPLKPNKYGLIKERYIDRKGNEQCNYYISSDMKVSLVKDDGNKCINKDGTETVGTVYWHIKGSHQMDSKEMHRLINSVVEDARACGIETMPREKLNQLLESWGMNHGNKVETPSRKG